MSQAFESMFCPLKNRINKPSLGQEKHTIGREHGAGSEGLSQYDVTQRNSQFCKDCTFFWGFLLFFWQGGVEKYNESIMYHLNRAEASQWLRVGHEPLFVRCACAQMHCWLHISIQLCLQHRVSTPLCIRLQPSCSLLSEFIFLLFIFYDSAL